MTPREVALRMALEVVRVRSMARLGEPNGSLKMAHHAALEELMELAEQHPGDPYIEALVDLERLTPYVKNNFPAEDFERWAS